VTIKGYMEEQEFYIAVEKKLEGLAIGRSQIRVGKRRTLNVKGKHVVGFQVTLNSLSESQSIAVQRGDMWSRRRFGCGVFVPMKEGGSL
jgi:CRISPR-associated protein Cas6